jgi:hypothetical protein
MDNTIYCHFSFSRPKGTNSVILAVALYETIYDKKTIYKRVEERELWENQQFITAIQSYEFALETIYRIQGELIKKGCRTVMLVTDNSTLVGWILNPKKNRAYTAFMNRAVEKYRVGAVNELEIGVGVLEAVSYEKAHKYCKREFLAENNVSKVRKQDTHNAIDMSNVKVMNINQIEENNPNRVEVKW